jgi:hypothetical protein
VKRVGRKLKVTLPKLFGYTSQNKTELLHIAIFKTKGLYKEKTCK